MFKFKIKPLCAFLMIFQVVCLFTAIPGLAQDEKTDTTARPYDALNASVAEALATEKNTVADLDNQLAQARQNQKSVQEKIRAYKIQVPILNNLLIPAETPVPDLEKGFSEIQGVLRYVSEKINEFTAKQNSTGQLLTQTREQAGLTEQQVADMPPKGSSDKISGVYEQFQALLSHLQKKQDLLTSLDSIYTETIRTLEETKRTFLELSNRFSEKIETRKKQALLERKTSLVTIGAAKIVQDFNVFFHQSAAVFTVSFWAGQLEFIRTAGGFYFVSFVLLFLMVQALLFRVRQYLIRIKDHPELENRFWNRLAFSIVRKSIFLLGSTMFVYLYARAVQFQAIPAIVHAGLGVLLVVFFSEMCIIALRMYCGESETEMPQKPAFYLRVLISMIRWFSIGYIFILWVADSNTTVQTVWRLAFEISLYGWNLFFWSVVHKRQKTGTTPWTPRAAAVINSIKLLSFFIVLTALILELSGYGLLAVYWLTSWTRSTVVILASILLLLVLLEWNPRVKKAADASFDAAATPKKSIRWAMVQFLVLVWFGSSVILLVFAWGGKQAVLLKIFDFLQHTYQVGTMRFSLMGLIVAVLILLLTQAVSRIWQHVFRKNILSQSGMEEGLQDSITTISVYAVWSVGILIALNAFGFNATSLTVVLGALGVGLGFGLQAIFNNFVSGIILLFERPIQVGDDIEVNGLWAQVRKINVRATVVQTYDNASIIIPNSDLISSQVTNWSFKDKRLRRNVAVGVAYGSDVELVRDTLLEVVDKTPRILKLPKPDVVFKDFGDSALIFMVRFWTRVEYFYSVETDVRFAIDRLFRERNIEIAFPQQDIHIRSGFDQKKPVILEKGAPVGVAESGKTDENPA